MKILTNLVLGLMLMASGEAIAQSSMKNPVSYHLKNGITLIVAENTGFGKIYASVESESHVSNANYSAFDQLDEHLNLNAKKQLSETFAPLTPKSPKITFRKGKANIASDIQSFSETFAILASTIQHVNCKDEKKDHFFRNQFVPSKLVITIAGDIKQSEAKRLVNQYFGTMQDSDFLAAQ